MPLYEYACSSCNSRFEVKQRFADAPLAVHQGCGGDLKRILQPVGIVFKGSGWYITDSRTAPSESSSGSASGQAA